MSIKELGNRVLKQNERIIEWCDGILSQNVPKEVVREVTSIKIETIEQTKALKNDLKKDFDEFTIKRFEKILNKVIDQNEDILMTLMLLAAENI